MRARAIVLADARHLQVASGRAARPGEGQALARVAAGPQEVDALRAPPRAIAASALSIHRSTSAPLTVTSSFVGSLTRSRNPASKSRSARNSRVTSASNGESAWLWRSQRTLTVSALADTSLISPFGCH